MENALTNRRKFIKQISISSTIALAIPDVLSASLVSEKKKLIIQPSDIILFQGDSITDVYRDRTQDKYNDAAALGRGYPFLTASQLLYKYPGKDLKFYNRANSGNRVRELIKRWQKDSLSISPNVISILIGVNDHWSVTRGEAGSVESFQMDLEELLNLTKDQNKDVKLLIGEPFGVPGIKGKHEIWDPVFKEYQSVVREMSRKFGAVFIPFQRVFDEAQKSAPGIYWTRDGVHPTIAGSKLMAEAWLSHIQIN